MNTFASSSGKSSGGGGGGRYDSMAAIKTVKRCTAKPKLQPQYKFHQKPLIYLSSRLMEIISRAFQKEEKVDEFDLILTDAEQFGRETVYQKQQKLEVLCKKTSFSRHEVKVLYWGWKIACPDGILNEAIFKEIYAQFFPQAGDSSLYAHYIFNAMFGETLAKNNDQISFLDYACALSALCRGTLVDKIRWIFTLYDINKDGRLTYEEVLQISIAIYALLGFNVQPAHNIKTYEEHAKKVFAKLDIYGVGYVTFDQFKDICLEDETIFKSMEQLDTSAI